MKSSYTPEIKTLNDGRIEVVFYMDITLVDSAKSQNKSNYEAARVIISPPEPGQEAQVEIISHGHPLMSNDEPAINTDHFKNEALMLSHSALAKDWLRPEEDAAWQDL